jgi:dihydrofolate reductase
MAKLIYTAISSLDGYVADAEGNFDWSVPDEEVHRFVNDLERPIGTYLLGRRMYEVMRYWDSASTDNDEQSAGQEYAKIWQATDKIVYSKSLDRVSAGKTRIEREFQPEAIKHLKATAVRDVSVGGPTLAAQALKLGLVDECHLFLPRRCGRRQSSPARQRPPRARAAGRAPLRPRRGPSALPHPGVTRSPKEHGPTIRATQYPAEDDGQHEHDGGHRGIAYRNRIRGRHYGEQGPAGREKEADNRYEP